MHRQAINRGRVAYEPNSLGGGCPFQAGARGFTSFPEDGVDGEAVKALHAGLLEAGAVPRIVGARLGQVTTEQDEALDVEVTLETGPAVLYDALAVPGGRAAVQALGNVGHALEFIKDQYRHCKPILALGEGTTLVENAGVPARLASDEEDPGLLLLEKGEAQKALTRFIQAIAKHRHFAREVDPPMV
jgi:catalase